MYKGIIYKYTSPNDKSYIGQTTRTLEQRARSYGSGYQRCKVFYDAILKYGWDNFTCEILTTIETNDLIDLYQQLNALESYYIDKYQTQVPNGYNIRSGGQQGPNHDINHKVVTGINHPNWRKDLDEELLQHLYLDENYTLTEIADFTHLSKGTIQRHLKEAGVLNLKLYNAPVVQLNDKGEILHRWESASAAARELGINSSTISRTCREHRRCYNGITYRYEGEKL